MSCSIKVLLSAIMNHPKGLLHLWSIWCFSRPVLLLMVKDCQKCKNRLMQLRHFEGFLHCKIVLAFVSGTWISVAHMGIVYLNLRCLIAGLPQNWTLVLWHLKYWALWSLLECSCSSCAMICFFSLPANQCNLSCKMLWGSQNIGTVATWRQIINFVLFGDYFCWWVCVFDSKNSVSSLLSEKWHTKKQGCGVWIGSNFGCSQSWRFLY